MSEFLQQIETAVGFKCWRVQVSHSTVSSRQSRSSFQERRSGYGVTIDCTPFKAALEREAAWEGRPEHLFPPIYLGSFAARTSAFSMDGGAERSSDAFSINLAATVPER